MSRPTVIARTSVIIGNVLARARRSHWVWVSAALGLGAVCALVAGIGTARAAPQVSAWATAINAGLLAATFIAILWYSVEARGMRREMLSQNEMAVRPLLLSMIEERVFQGRSVERIVVANIGKGPALFVQVQSLMVDPVARFAVAFEVVDVIEPGKREIVRARVYLDDKLAYDREDAFVASLKPSAGRDDYVITIQYEDVARRSHGSIVQMGKSGIRLLEHW